MREKTSYLRMALFCLLASAAIAGSASASGPVGGTVVGGQASIGSPSPTSTVINQTTQRAVINWQNFSVSSGSSVDFVQPNQSAITLNRVTGTSQSDIEGSLFANGQVWLINGNGILFGKGSRIDVGALIATTADIANGAFMSGDFNFNMPSRNPNAGVANNGTVTTASGGSAIFAGAYASNNGLVSANLGSVVLAGAATFRVDFNGDNLLGFAVTAPVATTPRDSAGSAQPALVSNSGTIAASGGRITMTTRAASAVVDNVINNAGMIDASSVSVKGGEVILDAGDGSVVDSGTIAAGGQSGGSIAVAGGNIALANAALDASGRNGGGTIAVGGTSTAGVTADKATTLDASATRSGNGGTISVKAQHTVFSGTARAKGGVAGGNGGRIETSGSVLDIAGARIDTSAPLGTTGTWTLDPENVDITNAPTAGETFASNTYTPGADNSVINASDLEAALALNNVVVNTGNVGTQAGDIRVAAPLTWSSTNTLTLDAFHSIKIDAAIVITGAGGLDLIINDGGSGGDITAGTGGSVQYTDLIGGVPQGSFAADGNSYTLLGTLAAVEAINSNLSGNFALADSLDASSIANWTPIGSSSTPFTGHFVGLGNTISNLTINTPTATNVGMFGVIGTTGAVYFLNLSSANVIGGNSVGILAGENDGTISGGSSSGTVTAVDFTDDGANGAAVGGLVGMNTDMIDLSSSSATVTGLILVGGLVGLDSNLTSGIRPTIANSFATGSVTGVADAHEVSVGAIGGSVGGLVGQAAFGPGCCGSLTQTPLLVNDYATGNVKGDSVVGGLAGDLNSGEIDNSAATGNVTATLNPNDPGGTVGSDGQYAGGLVGFEGDIGNAGTIITGSYATGAVSADQIAGGLIGVEQAGDLTTLSYASGPVTGVGPHQANIGGLIGREFGAIANAYATGTVSGATNVGGLVGFMGYRTANPNNSIFNNTSSSISDVWTSSPVSGTTNVGALVGDIETGAGSAGVPTPTVVGGYFDNQTSGTANGIGAGDSSAATVAGLTTAQLMTAGSFSFSSQFGLLNSGAVWVIVDSNGSLNNAGGAAGGTFPMLISEYSTKIFNAHQLQLMELDPTATYKLKTDINALGTAGGDVWGAGGFIPIGGNAAAPFTGIFEGNGATIDGLFIDDTTISTNFTVVSAQTAVGLFGILGASGSISDVSLTNVNISNLGIGASTGLVGALVGADAGGTISNASSSGTVSADPGTNSAVIAVGGLIGVAGNNANIQNSFSSANVVSAADAAIGGVIGLTSGSGAAIVGSRSMGTVSGGPNSYVGGFIGYAGAGSISQSSSTSTVSGVINSQIGGLAGFSSESIADSYATGSVTGSASDHVGGLVGSNAGSISQSYAMGPVSALDAASNVGGLLGGNTSTGTADQTYATGYVTALAGSAIGGLIGNNANSAGSITNSYYDTLTSGAANAIGAGTSSPGAIGETTTALQAGLPAGFSAGAWNIVAGTSYPYLSWQFASSTPQVVSGIVYSDSGVTPVGPGDTVNLLVNGNNPVTLTGSNLTGTGANGYYYFLLAPGTVPASNGQVIAYTKGAGGGGSFVDDANGSATGIPIWANTQWGRTPDTSASQVNADFHTARGSSPDGSYLGSLPNLYAISTAPNITFDQIVTFTGTITITANGPLTIASNGGFSSGAAGNAVTLVAPSFTNNAGSAAIAITGGGRWLIYTNAPGGDSFGSLDSANTAIWNTTYPTAIAAAGNRYVFTLQPAITVTSADLEKTFGDDVTSLVASDFTIAGVQPGVAGAFLADTAAVVYSGTPDVTSLGAVPGAAVSGSPYTITVGQGTLTVGDGYALDLVSAGLLTVKPSPVTSNPVLTTFVAQPPSSTTNPPSNPPPGPDQTSSGSTPPPASSPSTGTTQSSDTYVATAAPIATMTDTSGGSDSSDQAPESDGAATSIGESLDWHANGHASGVVIPGLLAIERRTVAKSTNGILSANQVFSSWGNDALWTK